MREIPLTQGYTALVSDKDYNSVRIFKWFAYVAPRGVYVRRNVRKKDGTRATLLLHRVILGVTDPKVDVDHKDHNGLNCQRRNIRVATRRQNMRNMLRKSKSNSGLKGVCWVARDSVWVAQINIDGIQTHLGSFLDKLEAAKAYDKAAIKHHGKFALINFPKEK